MPGPDYPWATYIPGGTWQPRRRGARATQSRKGPQVPPHSIVLHARLLDSPERIAALKADPDFGTHYVVCVSGAVIQLIPERGWCRHAGPVTVPVFSDPRSIAITLVGLPDQPSWPLDQVAAVARILSVIFSVHGHLPTADAGSIAAPPGRIHPIDAWPWLEMHARVLKLATPIERIYDAMLRGTPPDQIELDTAIDDPSHATPR